MEGNWLINIKTQKKKKKTRRATPQLFLAWMNALVSIMDNADTDDVNGRVVEIFWDTHDEVRRWTSQGNKGKIAKSVSRVLHKQNTVRKNG